MEVIGQLAEGVAHDFNNMLGVILGAAELLQSSEHITNQEDREYINMIIKSSGTAADLASKLMLLGRRKEKSSVKIETSKLINEFNQYIKKNY